MKILNAVRLLKSGKIVREQKFGLTIYRLNDNKVYRKTLNFPWESNGDLKEFKTKFHQESFEEIVDSQEFGLGYRLK